MKHDLLLWTGPVWAGNIASTKWYVPTDILSLSCEGSTACAAIATNLPATGMLQALLKSHGRSVDQYDKIMLGSFSAGHGFSNRLLSDPASRERLSAFCSFDSYYTGAAPGIKNGYLAFANMAASGNKYMWSSCSGFADRQWLSCAGSIVPLINAIDPSTSSLPGDLSSRIKTPTSCVSKGNFVHAFYGTTYAHAEHATVIAPAVFSGWISPGVHGQIGAPWLKTGALVAGLAAATYGAWKLGEYISSRRAS